MGHNYFICGKSFCQDTEKTSQKDPCQRLLANKVYWAGPSRSCRPKSQNTERLEMPDIIYVKTDRVACSGELTITP